MITMTLLSSTKTLDGHMEMRVQFTDGTITFDRDYNFYQKTQAEILAVMKEQCRQLAVSVDTYDKIQSSIGKSWTYNLATDSFTLVT